MSIQQTQLTNSDFFHKPNIPLYQQVKHWMLGQIKTGKFTPSKKLPGEFELMRTLSVSRGTIRVAIRELILDGILYTIRGHGTYVKEMKQSSWAVNTFLSVAESFDHTNTDYSTKLLEIGEMQADVDIASRLLITPNSPVVYMHRLRLIKNIPVHLSTSYLPYSIASKLIDSELNNASLYRVMEEKLGIKIIHVERQVTARLADEWELALLQLPNLSAIMVLNGTAFNIMDKPVECSIARFPTDRSQFIIHSRAID